MKQKASYPLGEQHMRTKKWLQLAVQIDLSFQILSDLGKAGISKLKSPNETKIFGADYA
ncbi:MAG: hypothetical protein AAGD96_04170 [Chloroflexota bacterium]